MVEKMRAVADRFDERVLIGELYLPIERLVAYYGTNGSGVHLPFNFHLIERPWNARVISMLIEEYESALPTDGWPNCPTEFSKACCAFVPANICPSTSSRK